MSATRIGSVLLLVALGGCGPEPAIGELSQAVLDERWWKDPLFQGSTPYHFADGHTWYDSDIGGGYVTGSYVRLPIDANYIADWSTGPVYCKGGGTAYFWSPVFQTTVNGRTTNWVFNHLSQSFLGPNGRTKGWYNGGALVGLTGGGTCDTGYPTYSTGPHFCNEMRDYDPYTYWSPVPDYASNCQGSNGTSGVANPVCGGVRPGDPCAGAKYGNGLYCGAALAGADPAALYDCQNGATASSTKCGCGCMQNPPGTNDACVANCGDPCSSAKYGNGGYCGGGLNGGDPNLLYDCENGKTANTTICKCGCTINPPKVPDVCATMCAPPPVEDMGSEASLDAGSSDVDARGSEVDAKKGAGDSVNGGCSVALGSGSESGSAGSVASLMLLIGVWRSRCKR